MSLFSVLGTLVFGDIEGNAKWDLIKAVWQKITQKSWEDLYLDAFEKAVHASRDDLQRKVGFGGEVAFNREALRQVLSADVGKALGETSLSTLENAQFARKLAQAITRRAHTSEAVVTIGGHTLSEDEYYQIAARLVNQAQAIFKKTLIDNEPAFRAEALHEAHEDHDLLLQVNRILNDQFSLSINLLEGIQSGIEDLKKGQDRLFEAVSTQQPRQRACPTAPPPPAHFSGRVEQLTDLRQRLASGQQTAITAVHGLGGMGKTTLAKAFAKLATHELGYSAVLWAEITRSPNALRWLESWAQYADPAFSLANVPPETPPEALAGHVRSLLTALIAELCPGRVLVVLDDVWPEGIAAARLLIQAAPEGSALFITTRFEDAARQLRCKLLPVPRLPEPEAIELLDKLIDNKTATPEHLTALAKLLGGHPLALELAAGSVNLCEGASEIGDLLAKYKKGLRDGVPFHELELGEEAGAKEDSLIVSFQISYDALDTDLQRRFRAMGIFTPDVPWNVQLVAYVWDEVKKERTDEEIEAPVKGAIKALRLRGLLAPTRLEGYPDGWYEPHPLLRAYARALLSAAGELETTRDRYERAVIGIARAGFKRPKQEWRDRMTLYLPHIHAVGDDLAGRVEAVLGDLEPLAQPEPANGTIAPSLLDPSRALLETGSDFVAAVKGYVWFRRETGETGRRWLIMGLVCARILLQQTANIDQQSREELFTDALGTWHNQRGQNQRAIAYHLASLEINRKQGTRRGEAATLSSIGVVYRALGDYPQALRYYNEALPIMREVGDRPGKAATLNNIGMVYYALGDNQQALRYYNEALPILREVGDRSGEATTLNNIGMVKNDLLGDRHQALHYYNEALPIILEVGDRAGEASILNNIGKVYHDLGNYQQALAYYHKALPIRREVGDRYCEAMTCFNIAMILRDEGHLAEAVAYLERCVELDEQVQHPDLENDRAMLARVRAELRREAPPASAAQTMPAEQLNMVIQGTVAVLTFAKDKRAEWRGAVAGALEQVNGGNWQNEVDFFTAILALLDGEEAALPADHPYVEALRAIQEGIAAGGVSQAASGGIPEHILTEVIKTTVAVMTTHPDKHEEWRSNTAQNLEIARKNGAEQDAAFFSAILALLDGEEAALPAGHPYAEALRAVQEGIAAGELPSEEGYEESEKEFDPEKFMAQMIADPEYRAYVLAQIDADPEMAETARMLRAVLAQAGIEDV